MHQGPVDAEEELGLGAAANGGAAFAKAGAYGIWEGRIVSLAHPVVMVIFYVASMYAGFSGLQWRAIMWSRVS